MTQPRRAVAAILLVLPLGCRGAEEAAQNQGDAAPAAQAAPAGMDAAAISLTAEDSVIFASTVAWVREQRLDTLPTGELMASIGRRFVGAPYVPKTLDPPGPERLIVNLRTFDCVTYVETMFALARVIRAGRDDFAVFVDELRRIRYRTGEAASYPERLHYFSDWIAANESKGLVRNMTPDLGGVPDTARVDFMSTHADLYWQLADSAVAAAVRSTEAGLSARLRTWIPQDSIARIAGGIRNGDIIAATSTVPGLDIAHTGLALWLDGRLHLMHAPLVGSVVEISEVPLAERIRGIGGQDGIMVARPL